MGDTDEDVVDKKSFSLSTRTWKKLIFIRGTLLEKIGENFLRRTQTSTPYKKLCNVSFPIINELLTKYSMLITDFRGLGQKIEEQTQMKLLCNLMPKQIHHEINSVNWRL